MPADPTAKRRTAALGRFRTAVAVAREQRTRLSRANATKYRVAAECVALGVAKGELARMAETTPNQVREWVAKGEG